MAVPKFKRSKSRQGQRRMHLFIKRQFLAKCPKCGNKVLSHTVCQNCGYYKGREVIDVLKKLTKKEKKQKEKEMRTREEVEKKDGKAGGMSWEGMSKR